MSGEKGETRCSWRGQEGLQVMQTAMGFGLNPKSKEKPLSGSIKQKSKKFYLFFFFLSPPVS